MIEPNLDKISTELKALPQWVCWKLGGINNEKPTKIPVNSSTGANARANDPATWTTFEKTKEYYLKNCNGGGAKGIGFVVSKEDPYLVVDLDHCRNPETGIIEPWARDIIKKLNSYSEISPSGSGVHIFSKGELPGPGNKKGDFEIYQENRYITVTGHHLTDTPLAIEERQGEIIKIHREIFGQETRSTNTMSCGPSLSMTDDEIIAKARKARNGSKFEALYAGNTFGYFSRSEADLALVALLAFYTQDPVTLDRLFRSSGLMREKWDRSVGQEKTYGRTTVEKALSGVRETYQSPLSEPQNTSLGADKPAETRLNNPLEIIKKILGNRDIRGAFIKILKTPKTLQAFVLVALKMPEEYAASLLEMKQLGIPAKDIETLKKIIKKISQEQTISQEKENLTKAGDLLSADCPFPDLIIPSNYILTMDGIFSRRDKLKIAFCPIGITARLKNDEEGLESLKLAWRRLNKWEERVIDRGVVLEGRRLVQMASYGFPVAGENSSKLASFIHHLEAINMERIPSIKTSSHLGWQGRGGKDGFLWGRQLILPDGHITPEISIDLKPTSWKENWVAFQGTTPGDDQMVKGFHSGGTIEGWKETIRILEKFPKVLVCLYASLAPPLIEIVDAPNSTVDFSSRTSVGKTTTLRVGASAWGYPDEKTNGTLFSWDITKVWLERASGILNGLPLILDDTKRVKKTSLIAEVIYMVSQGRGRGRGDIRSLATTKTWRTNLISSGESPATSFSQAGGTRTRCLQIRGLPFKNDSDETRHMVDKLNSQLMVHYGHAGPAFVSHLLKNRNRWPSYKEQYQEFIDYYAEEAGFSEGGRLARGFAALHLAEVLAHEAGLIPWSYRNIIHEIWHEVAIEGIDAAGEVRALQDIISWAYSNISRFYGRYQNDWEGNPRLISNGWAGRWDPPPDWEFIGFFPTILRKELSNLGFEPEGILAAWKAKGWLEITKGERGYTIQKYLDKEKTRLIVILRKAIEAVE